MPFILGTNSIKDTGGYQVDNSLRFNKASSDYLVKTFDSNGSLTTWTLSYWIKRSELSVTQGVFSSEVNGDNSDLMYFQSSDKFDWWEYTSAYKARKATNMLFRDISAFYNIVCVWDTSNSTEADRQRIYVNGERITSFATNVEPALNEASRFNSTVPFDVGRSSSGSSGYFGGYMSEVCFIDGQALAADSFGEFDEDSGIWKPIDVSGLTFGTNGFYLETKQSGTSQNSSGLGADTSGNDNHFAVNNLTAVDQTTDTCTNNHATMNPLDNYYASAVFAEGNIKLTTNASAEAMSTATFAVSAGRWYFEVDCIAIGSSGTAQLGVTARPSHANSSYGKTGDVTPFTHAWSDSGALQSGNGSGGQTALATLSSYAAGDILGVYLDLEDMKTYWSKNGTLENSGTGIALTALASNGTGHYIPFVGDYNTGGAAVFEVNFGNGFQALANTAIADDNGYGAFEYSPNITGDGAAKKFYTLNTKNLAEFGG